MDETPLIPPSNPQDENKEVLRILLYGGIVVAILLAILLIKENFSETPKIAPITTSIASQNNSSVAASKPLLADPQLKVLSDQELSVTKTGKTAEEIYKDSDFAVKITLTVIFSSTTPEISNNSYQLPISTEKPIVGSGIVVNSAVYGPCVLTAAHLIQKNEIAKDLKIHFKNGTAPQEAEIIGIAQNYDIMLLKFKDAKFVAPAPAKIAKSARLNPGARVMAIGSSAGGDFWFSAYGFLYTAPGKPNQVISNIIRIYPWPTVLILNLSIFSGYSGGPILNERGELVGMSIGIFPAEYQLISIGLPIDDVIQDMKNGLTPP